MNSHLLWLKQEHDDEDPDEAYTPEDQLVYDNRGLRHLTQGLTTHQYQQIQTYANLHPALHPPPSSSQNPLNYRPDYSLAHSQAHYHLHEPYPAGVSLDGYSRFSENQAHFDDFGGIGSYNNHAMAAPDLAPPGSHSLPRPTLITKEGLPTEQDFGFLVTEYIGSLSIKKRDKALIPQSRYYYIRQVLSDPKCTTIESAQFRFWAKKMFTLDDTPDRNVCHEDKPVAVREDLYIILSNAHVSCNHGGRDKTSGMVRQRCSWVPKELIARYVKICPTCMLRRHPTLNDGAELQPRQQLVMVPEYSPPGWTPPVYNAAETMNTPQPYVTGADEQQYVGATSGTGQATEAPTPYRYRVSYHPNRR